MKTIEMNGEVVPNDFADVYDYLGLDYIAPSVIKQELSDADGDDVELEINSPGGYVDAGSEIYTAIKEYSGNVTAKITGQACSAASFLALAADKVLMSPTAQMMIHRAATVAEGNTDDFASAYQALDSIDQSLVNVYADKTGLDKQEIYQMMSKTTWLNAQQALDKGFVDEIMFDKQPAFANADGHLSVAPDQINKIKQLMAKNKPVNKQEDLENKKRQLVKDKLALLFRED